ncbi:hypothetical protein [Blastopirellula marina]|uniref:Uncharacterized protein n=1 Tax=Blastopirellula marina DSM 3645 TaxID=314230 RepID=A3ZZ59_9BACT|nr:hypothetical protein [Blastopirellula marina]EAQ78207.1 hypothetical protein DSM3645_15560 [Blastopirellula marina DSM 3645]
MFRYLIALFCVATLSLATTVAAAEPGEGLIDGLIAQIRQLEQRLERIESQVDKNSAAIDRNTAPAPQPKVVAQPQKQPKQAQPAQKEKSMALDWTPQEPVDYSGRWLMTLPLGAEHHVAIKKAKDNQLKLVRPRLNLAGVYQVDGATLTIVRPADKRLTGFVWTAINRNTLILTGEPPQGRTGSSYVGATLTRLVESPESR